MSDESCSGDFTGDDDLTPLAHRKTKTDCQEYLELWADPPVCMWNVLGEGGFILDAPAQPTDGLAGRTKQISTESLLS